MAPNFFMHSQDSVRVDFDSRRLGSRHAEVRDVSYEEAGRRMEDMGL